MRMTAITERALEKLAGRVGALLVARAESLVTAESCTGGMAAQALTALSGASAWFERGFITYSNAAKRECLGVQEMVLAVYGAVSEETARGMAEGALAESRADWSLAITGIAGPEGGTREKPVGTVAFAWASRAGFRASRRVLLEGDRCGIRRQAVAFALRNLGEILSCGQDAAEENDRKTTLPQAVKSARYNPQTPQNISENPARARSQGFCNVPRAR
jgi:nicotinamide-nucleotide amidase